MKAHLTKIVYVECAHSNHLGNSAQQRLHGHSYRLELLAGGDVAPEFGWVVDYGDVKDFFQPIEEQLDHAYLNEVPGLEDDTSLDAVRDWIDAQLRLRYATPPAWWSGVRVTIASNLAFRPVLLPKDTVRDLPERLHFSFEAAQSLPQLPQGHPCRKIHGHSYQVEVAAASLEGLEQHLRTIYDIVDHQYLNNIEGIEFATCEYIARWMWRRLEALQAPPSMVMVQETSSAQCLYVGE